MGVSEVLAVLWSVVGFPLLRAVNNILQSVWWKLTGIDAQFTASLSSPISQKRVQVLRVVWKKVGDKFPIPSSPESIYWHEDFYPMDYLMKPNVSFFTVTSPDEVIFVETTPGIDVFDLRAHPFTFGGQVKHEKRMIRVNAADLVAYAESLKEPGVNVVWIHHSTRCGSTALAQALASLPNWKAISEIHWLVKALPKECKTQLEIESHYKSRQFHDLAKACIKVQLLHFPDGSNFCWKTVGWCEAYLLQMIAEEFPKHKIIYMLRNGQQTANSMYRILSQQPVFARVLQFFNKYPDLALWFYTIDYYRKGFTSGLLSESVLDFWMDGHLTTYEFLYGHWLTNLVTLKEYGSNIPIMIIEYDFYRKNLTENLEKVLKYVGAMSPTNLQLAVDSYAYDSQANSPLSQDVAKQGKSWARYERTVEKVNKLAVSFNFPSFDERITPQTFNTEKWTYIMD